jgi:integrase
MKSAGTAVRGGPATTHNPVMEGRMSEYHPTRIVVWVQKFRDRDTLMLQWHDPITGKRKSQSTGTNNRGLAEMKKSELEYELNHGLHQEASRISWEAFRELFEAEYVAGKRANTRAGYDDTLNQFERLCNPGRLAGITERTVSAYLAGMRKEKVRGREGMKPGTMKVRLQFLRTALRWAVEQGMLAKCPKFPKVEMDERFPQPVPVESFERIYQKAEGDAQMQAYLLAGWLAGLRLSEAYELEWEETEEAPYVDLARDRIVLPAKVAKGKKDQWVPLDPQLREALLALPRHGKKVFRFISQRTKRPVRPDSMSDRVVRLAKKAGVRLTMHTLRKGFGCRYAGKVPAQVLQKLMRHRSIKTTMDYYANVDAAVMEAVLGAKRNSSRNSAAGAEAARQEGDSAIPSPETSSDLT